MPPTGSTTTAGSGTRALIAWATICARCKPRRSPVAARTGNSPATPPAERVLELTRIFAAPRDLVFKVWIEPEHLVRWWGPRGFTMPSHALEARPGGAYR